MTTPSYNDIYSYTIAAAGQYNNVPPAVALGLIQVESGFDPNANANINYPNSHAFGLTQLQPGVATQYGATDPTNWKANIDAGLSYLSDLTDQFGSTNAGLAAYYQGPKNYSNGVNASDGQTYVTKVLDASNKFISGTGSGMGTLATGASTIDGARTWLTNIESDLTGGFSDRFNSAVNGAVSTATNPSKWFDNTSFVERIAIFMFGLILFTAGIFFLNPKGNIKIIKGAALAA